jgi:hypothetical protein
MATNRVEHQVPTFAGGAVLVAPFHARQRGEPVLAAANPEPFDAHTV